MRLLNNVLSLTREVAVACVPELFSHETLLLYVPGFQLVEDQDHSEKRAQLAHDAQLLQTAEQEICNLLADVRAGEPATPKLQACCGLL